MLADSLCTKISPIFYIANPNPSPAGPNTPQYENYPVFYTNFWLYRNEGVWCKENTDNKCYNFGKNIRKRFKAYFASSIIVGVRRQASK